MIILILEFAVAVVNTAIPMATITEDVESIDIPMKYLSQYMQPVTFSSLALVYRVWLDLQEAGEKG